MVFSLDHVMRERITRYTLENSESLKGMNILSVGPDSYIGGVDIDTAIDIVDPDKIYYNFQIGNNVAMADHITCIMDIGHDIGSVCLAPEGFAGKNYFIHDEFKQNRKGQIIIENDCWIGRGVTILNGVTIHNGAVIGAGAVVAKDIPPYAIAVGNPARVIRYRFEPEIIDSLLKIAWWYWPHDKLVELKDDFKLDSLDFIKKHDNQHDRWCPDMSEIASYPVELLSEGKAPVYLFFVDYHEDVFYLTERVLHQFIQRFHSFDAELILYLPADGGSYKESLERILIFLSGYEYCDCYISICDTPAETEWSLFVPADYYITNRSEHNIERMNMAQMLGVKCISGVDSKIFG